MKKKLHSLLKSKIVWIFFSVLVVIRIFLPFVVLQKLNQFLGEFSPVYAVHIDDLDLGILRGAYRFSGVTAFLKKKNQIFFKGEMIDVSLAWRELLQRQVVADVLGNNIEFIWTPEFKDALAADPDRAVQDAKTVNKKLFPFRITRVDVRNSTFQYADLPGLPEVERWKVTDLHGRFSNILPTETNPLSHVTAKGTLFGSSTMNVVGHLDKLATPPRWDVDLELKEFNLVKANDLLRRKIPLTFASGFLDVYVEAKSERGKIEGSVKPFFKKVDVMEKGEHFLGLKHFGVEIGVAAVNLILKNAKDQVVATKIIFSYDKGEFQLNSQKALSEAIANGFREKIPLGIENDYQLSILERPRKSNP